MTMLISIDNLLNIPVMSLQTGARLALTTAVIVDPRQLTVAAFYVEGPTLSEAPSVLHPSDIRELSDLGFIVDSDAKLMGLDGLVRLNEIIGFGFELMNLKVVDEHKRKLGKVNGFSVETSGYTVQQIYTEQSLLRSIGTAGSTIHRNQIISVNNDMIIVQSPSVRDELKTVAHSGAQAFTNPFRGTTQIDNLDG